MMQWEPESTVEQGSERKTMRDDCGCIVACKWIDLLTQEHIRMHVHE